MLKIAPVALLLLLIFFGVSCGRNKSDSSSDVQAEKTSLDAVVKYGPNDEI